MKESSSVYQNTERLAGLLSIVLAVGLQILAGMLMIHICGWQVRPAPELLQLFTVVLPAADEAGPAGNAAQAPIETTSGQPSPNEFQPSTMTQQTTTEPEMAHQKPKETVSPKAEEIIEPTPTPVEKETEAFISKPVDTVSKKTAPIPKIAEPAKIEPIKKVIRKPITGKRKPEFITQKNLQTPQVPAAPPAPQIAAMPSATYTPASPSSSTSPAATQASPALNSSNGHSHPGTTSKPLTNDEQKAIARYLTQIRRSLEKGKKYPPEARKGRIEGQVQVKFRIAADGQATDAMVTGQAPAILAESVLQMLVGRRFPAPPAGWQPSVAVELKINFNLH